MHVGTGSTCSANISTASPMNAWAKRTSSGIVLSNSDNYSLTPFDLFGINQDTLHSDVLAKHHHISASFQSDLDTSSDPLHSSTPTRQSKQDKHPNRPLRLLNVNFQSSRGKSAVIHNLFQHSKPDIVIGSETWLDPDIRTPEISPPPPPPPPTPPNTPPPPPPGGGGVRGREHSIW